VSRFSPFHPHSDGAAAVFRLGRLALALTVSLTALGMAGQAWAEDPPDAPSAPPSNMDTGAADPAAEAYAIHGQMTFTDQGHLAFRAPYSGPNSLSPDANGRETLDITLYGGLRLWKGAELWVNSELDQGFGLNDTLGLAGFSSAEAYKVGKVAPYFRLPRLFVRQTIDLGGGKSSIGADLNQLAGSQSEDRLVITVGKFGVTDIFDNNQYAHDPRHDFLNWAVVDTGSYDYAADAWGYSYGAAAEWYQGRWTLRAGVFNLSDVPNSTTLNTDFSEFQIDAEVEERHDLWGRAGKLKITGFLSRARMGKFDDAVALAMETGQLADIAAVRHYRGRPGFSVNLEQQVSDNVGVFARGGVSAGDVETYEFTDIDRSLSAGVSVNGKVWNRPKDTFGFAGVINGISKSHERFLEFGGLGPLIGDGQLPHPGQEGIIESYYEVAAFNWAQVTLDYQYVANPAYNKDRGPVNIFAIRLHAQF
jgi:high affinity Mn2+ porin